MMMLLKSKLMKLFKVSKAEQLVTPVLKDGYICMIKLFHIHMNKSCTCLVLFFVGFLSFFYCLTLLKNSPNAAYFFQFKPGAFSQNSWKRHSYQEACFFYLPFNKWPSHHEFKVAEYMSESSYFS